jgi:peptide/nickel transport system substrate-binding protein
MIVEGVEDLEEDHPLVALDRIRERFPVSRHTTDPTFPGGHIQWAQSSATPFGGNINPVFWINAQDGDIVGFFSGGSVFSSTPIRTFGQDGIVTWTHDLNEMSMVLTQVEDVLWHDGVPMTLSDLAFALEIICHPRYIEAGGPRFGAAQRMIRGVNEYHAGEVDYISGLVLSNNDRQLKIYFNEFPPSVLYFSFWTTPLPRHIFGDIDIMEIPNHPRSRVNPVGFGPWILNNIVPGESVHYIANDTFWLGRPYADELTLRVVDPGMIPMLMLEGEFDIASFRPEDYRDIPNPTNFSYLGDVANTFGVLAFNLGEFNNDTGRIEPFENARMGDVRLRQAMSYAIDVQTVADTVFEGFRLPATSVIPPGHAAFLDPDLRGYPYSPERANELLDEAGFLMGPDGYRTDQDGNPFEIHLIYGISPINDLVFMAYRQNWADVGLNVRLDPQDFSNFMSPEIFNAIGERPPHDISVVNWTAGFNPNPNTLWGHTLNNIPRFMNDEMEAVLNSFNTMQAWDQEWLIGQYKEWQRLYNVYVPGVITDWRVNIVAVNNRVSGYSPFNLYEDGNRTRGGSWRIRLTAADPYRQ